MAERKAVIKNADMSEDMQQDAVDCASQALEKYNIEKVRLLLILSYKYIN
jgi:dynein light chain LC8-type